MLGLAHRWPDGTLGFLLMLSVCLVLWMIMSLLTSPLGRDERAPLTFVVHIAVRLTMYSLVRPKPCLSRGWLAGIHFVLLHGAHLRGVLPLVRFVALNRSPVQVRKLWDQTTLLQLCRELLLSFHNVKP